MPLSLGADGLETDEDTPITIDGTSLLVNDASGPANESAQTLAVLEATSGAHGVAAFDPLTGTITFTPGADYFGTASFTYTACDDGTTNGESDVLCSSATVSVDVAAVNDAPVAEDDSATTSEIHPVSEDVIANDGDVDTTNGQLRVKPGSLSATNGTASLDADGRTIQFTPAQDENDATVDSNGFTVTYTATDGDKDSGQATLTIAVSEVNDQPTAEADTSTVAEDAAATTVDVVANDVKGPANESGQTLSVQSVGTATHGTVTLVGGVVQYAPDADYNGSDSFTYVVTDDGTTAGVADPKTATATVTITVTPVNDKPRAENGSFTTDEDAASLSVNLRPFVSDVETSVADLTYSVVSGPAASQGELTQGANGLFTFVPTADYNGDVTVTYTVTDRGDPDACSPVGSACAGAKASDLQTVTVTVREVNDQPTANDDTLTVAEDAAATTVDVLGNDVKGPANESGQMLSVQSVGSASHGTVTLVGGVVTYVPNADYHGSDSFTYVVTDDGTTAGVADPRADTSTVSITVTPVNDAPVVTAGSAKSANEGQNSVTVTASFTDVDTSDTFTAVVAWGDGTSSNLGTVTAGRSRRTTCTPTTARTRPPSA